MLLTTDSSSKAQETAANLWKSPWEARRETRGMLTGGGYDTEAMERYFLLRPERAWARLAQVGQVYGDSLPMVYSE